MSGTFCERCGRCCRSGGAALHRADILRMLTENSVARPYLPENVVTFRRGELAHDQVTERLAPLTEELIKLRGVSENDWCCCFFDGAENACTVYETRPEECRVLSCRNIAPLAAMYDKERLTRKELLDVVFVGALAAAGVTLPAGASVAHIAALIDQHEDACSYEKAAQILSSRPLGSRFVPPALQELLRLDDAFREVFCERTGIPASWNDFLFGRRLAITLPRMYELDLSVK